MAYTAIGLRGKKGLSLSRQSSEQIRSALHNMKTTLIKQISFILCRHNDFDVTIRDNGYRLRWFAYC